MFKTFRAAGLAAAALLCSANSAAAEDVSKSAPLTIAAATPTTAIPSNAPAVNAEQAVITAAPAATPPGAPGAEAALVPGRARPDHQIGQAAAPAATPAVGVIGAAGTRRSLEELVAEHAGDVAADEQFECLASAVYFESRGEPLAGQLAVAEVILNRVSSGRFRSTICDVVKQPSQFSFVRRGVIPAANRDSAAWHRAVAIAHIALNDLHDVTGNDSLFFHATYVNPRWGRPRIARIGNHIFYR